ncbi:MarR family winged helix-turn-helix transcriptional regulator [Flexibacterium corallicola]|uniref:MarR family winged helix-turn-helix transcriptional regulator n=1 Tax=Flexibacterium corallicola TaxID=3037259 RepID=UPI00286F1D01|nr:MarR family transcriptional regulator [Pseudovibrio sp. M1P-2-3]
MQIDQIANQLSAISTALEDASIEAYGDLSPSAVAALLAMRRAPSISIGAIALEVKLSHSATVRLVDRLEKDWLVRRQRRRGREVMVELTARGKRKAAELAEARQKAACQLFGSIAETDLENLHKLFSTILSGLNKPACARFCLDNPIVAQKEPEPA